MRKNLIDDIDLPSSSWHMPDGDNPEPDLEADGYDRLVTARGVDLAFLGLGPGLTCHIGFNERGSAFDSRTRLVSLDPDTINTNKQLFREPGVMPKTALTQGLGTILEAKKITLIAKGQAKAAGVARFLTGPVNTDAPASCLRLHPHVTVVLDCEAASQL
jgi:glucosamine-6-phosphate deaminase